MSGAWSVQDGASLSFVAMVSDSAYPFDIAWAETEVLIASGISDPRWRTVRSPKRSWPVECYAEASTYAIATGIARQYQNSSGRIGRLRKTIAGSSYTWTRVHGELQNFQIVTGPITGPAVTGGNQACHIRSSWVFQLTELSINP